MARTVFFISDGTGITAETLGRSLLTQFEAIDLEFVTIPYVDHLEKARATAAQITQAQQKDGERPLIFATLINPEISAIVKSGDGLYMDFFQNFIGQLEDELKFEASHAVGRFHSAMNYNKYMLRINAVNYALVNDDGANVKEYGHADIVLIGVSRCGKTPTCLYLALQFGIFAANYPLTEEDLNKRQLPEPLHLHRHKLFGLSIDPFRLHQIRQERLPNSHYASLEQCQNEIKMIERLFDKENVRYLNTTTRSIEELAADILSLTGIKRKF